MTGNSNEWWVMRQMISKDRNDCTRSICFWFCMYSFFFQFGTRGGYINELSSKSLEHAEPANINHAHGERVL